MLSLDSTPDSTPDSTVRTWMRRLRWSIAPPSKAAIVRCEDAFPEAPTVTLAEGHWVQTPETAFMNLDPFAAYIKGKQYWAPTLTTTHLSDVLFCPVNNCVLTDAGTLIAESTGPGARGAQVDHQPFRSERPVTDLPGCSTAFRCAFNDFYHLLVDNLSRFALLHAPHFRQFDTIQLLCPEGVSTLERYFIERLCPPNVDVVPVASDRLYRAETYLLTSFPTRRASGYVHPDFVQRMHRTFAHPLRDGTHQRIYISRAKAPKGRHVLNEAALMDRLRPLGFEMHHLEQDPIEEQIARFANAECVVAPHGAGLAHLLFASGTKVLELFGTSYVAPHYYLLSKAVGLEYRFICGHGDALDADFRVRPDEVVQHVQSLLRTDSAPSSALARPSAS